MCWLGFGLAFLGLGFAFFKPEPRYMAWAGLGLAWLKPWVMSKTWLTLREVNNNIKII